MVQRLRAPQRRPRWPGGGRGGLPTALAAARKQASLDVPALGSGPPRRGWSIVEERPRSSPAAPADPRGCGRRARRAGPHGGNLLPEAGSGGPGAEGQPRPRPPRGAAGTAN
ncbi:unnamed protein product [Prorocentrum cordatum]|uniref:Uncharacterized protein n=1 Tax=Prorocentrum cordatum TaxID=2364126 RepID=A0ABN9QUV5_9DINO|nr:unnamed protein product [Polarella glacialis]